MPRILLAALLASLALPGCRQMPESRATLPVEMHSSAVLMPAAAAGGSSPVRGSPYAAAIVNDLVFAPEDLASLGKARGELAALFGAAFRQALKREGYVRLALPEGSGADVVTIQPATMRISPAYELDIAVAVRDSGGRFLGWYAVHYSAGWRDTPPSRSEALRLVFADAGEQAAKAIARGR
jgi:hypothetical protein